MVNAKKPHCKLVGTDGNVYNIIGLVEKTLKNADLTAEAEEFKEKAFNAGSYLEVLQLVMEYVEVE